MQKFLRRIESGVKFQRLLIGRAGSGRSADLLQEQPQLQVASRRWITRRIIGEALHHVGALVRGDRQCLHITFANFVVIAKFVIERRQSFVRSRLGIRIGADFDRDPIFVDRILEASQLYQSCSVVHVAVRIAVIELSGRPGGGVTPPRRAPSPTATCS